MLSHRLSSMTSCASSRSIPLVRRPVLRAGFSSTTSRPSYEDTIQNLKIGRYTRVIFQGFTGRQATANAKESIDWGTNIVGGVKPGSEGEHLGLPVFSSVRAAQEKLKPDATGIYVAAHQATAAIEEAIEAEIPLIVAVAEHIPLHDILRVRKSYPRSIHVEPRLTCDTDTLHTQHPVQIQTRRRQRPGHHLSNRTLSNWIPAAAMLCSGPHWRGC